ncbi:MAG: hypothetical protein AAB328_04185, partial [candidate division NC10 bacterium]
RDWHWSFEDEPVLVLIMAVVLPNDGNLPRRPPDDFLAQINTARTVRQFVLNFVDLSEKQKSPGAQVA